ncbi:oxidoreductase [Mycobacterium sp. C31M]
MSGPDKIPTADDTGRLAGRVAIVTGANSGLGFATARGLATRGAHVVLGCRDPDRGRLAADRLRSISLAVQVYPLDLAHLDSIAQFAEHISLDHDGVDILVNNAGVSGGPRRLTVDGFEMQFGTNHLGHFALTGLLLPVLLARPGARVVTVTSTAAAFGRIDFADLQSENSYGFVTTYTASKLANLMFALELDRRSKRLGVDLISTASHPGIAATNIVRAKGSDWGRRRRPSEFAMSVAQRMFGQPASGGALPSLYAATAPNLVGGEYVVPGGYRNMRGAPVVIDPPRRAHDAETSARLWEESMRLTGVAFTELPTSGV